MFYRVDNQVVDDSGDTNSVGLGHHWRRWGVDENFRVRLAGNHGHTFNDLGHNFSNVYRLSEQFGCACVVARNFEQILKQNFETFDLRIEQLG